LDNSPERKVGSAVLDFEVFVAGRTLLILCTNYTFPTEKGCTAIGFHDFHWNLFAESAEKLWFVSRKGHVWIKSIVVHVDGSS